MEVTKRSSHTLKAFTQAHARRFTQKCVKYRPYTWLPTHILPDAKPDVDAEGKAQTQKVDPRTLKDTDRNASISRKSSRSLRRNLRRMC
eukprot:2615394-Pleurochrysis_carterae.AAC.1